MYTTQLTWFSPPHSPAGGFAPKPFRSPLLPLSLKNYNMRQVLLLYCTVLAVPFRTVYVDRFACNWHRLATTDLSCPIYYNGKKIFLQVNRSAYFYLFSKSAILFVLNIERKKEISFMIAIPQCLDFADARLTKDICEFYLRMLDIKNREIYLHSQQVANYSASTAAKLGLPASEVSQIKTAALLHDIGQLSVPNIILAKLPFLSTREQSIYKRHCIAGASMLENIPGFDTISDIIRAHHEKWDGTGYPKRLKGQNIPIGARIVAVANYYDRNLNPCTQHWQKTHADAIIELQNKAGLDFEPAIVKAFIESVIPQSLRTQLK